jgi:hypothetical protein
MKFQKKLLEGKHFFIDPEKRSLFPMMDDDGNDFSYTNRIYLKETKRLKYQALLKNYRDKILYNVEILYYSNNLRKTGFE